MSPEDLQAGQTEHLIPPELKERYRGFRLIGAGGMGRVFAAMDKLLDKQVAIKVLPTNDNMKSIMRFQQEAKAASKLNHPGIVQVMDFGYTTNGSPYMVMEYVTGTDLDTIAGRSEKLPPLMVIDLAIAVAAALEHAHSRGVVHRDLKPANLILAEDGAVRILDFGLARLSQSETDWRLTAPGQCVGSPLYMSPEQIRGEEADASSDVYSLALVIYKLINGWIPGEGDSLMQLVQ